MKRKGALLLAVAVLAVSVWGVVRAARAATPVVIILDVDVGQGASIGMGPGGMGGSVMTGGGPILMNGQQFGTMMHSSMTATMQSMLGSQTLQHRLMSFEIPAMGTLFAMMAGGNPWTGGKGIIMGGTDGLQGASGTFTVGAQVGATQYQFNCTIVLP